MPNRFAKQFTIITLAILFSVLLLWNSGAGAFNGSALQISDTPAQTDTPTEQTAPPEEQNPEAITPSSTPVSPSPTDEPIPSETPTVTGASSPSASSSRSLSAAFASGAHTSNELIVRFKPSTRETRIEECFQNIDVQIQSEIEVLKTLVLSIPSGEVASAYDHILDCAGVLYVEPNFLLQAADTIPNDPDFGLQYGLVNIRAPQGWDLTTGSDAVTIAIVDTGVDYSHPDLAGKLVGGYDFVNNDTDPQDDNGHGTHVAGIAAASSNNGVGITGVSWGARIMPVKVLNFTGGGTYANTAKGVIWAVDHGAQVINLSLGGTGEALVLADAINYAHGKGAVVVAAAGNYGNNFVLYPARYPNVIAVARTNSTNNWDGSNYGPEVDLAAPGTMIYSTIIGGYDYKSGSSMATGYVSGLSAILKGIPGNFSPDAIESQMESTALDIEFAGWDDYTGAGLIQMDAAIQLAWPPTATPGQQEPSSAGNVYIPGQTVPTNTPVPTWTFFPTPTIESKTSTPTVEVGSTPLETPTSVHTPTQSANEVEAQSGTPTRSNYVLPCTGIFFIFLGLLLAWFFRKRKNN